MREEERKAEGRREREKGDIDDLIFRGDAAPGPSER